MVLGSSQGIGDGPELQWTRRCERYPIDSAVGTRGPAGLATCNAPNTNGKIDRRRRQKM